MKRSLSFAIFALSISTAFAHDVPDDVLVRAILKPSGGHMQAIVRIPVNALLDVEFPELRDTDYIDLSEAGPFAAQAATMWYSNKLALYENGTPLPRGAIKSCRLSWDTDPSFTSFSRALDHVNGPEVPPDSLIDWNHAVLDVLLDVPIHSDRSSFSLLPRWGRLGVLVYVTLEFVPTESGAGAIRLYQYEGDPPRYELNPTPQQAALRFLDAGLTGVPSRTDCLLFLFCLAILFRRFRALIRPAALFTSAYCLALAASAYAPQPPPLWAPLLAGTLVSAAIVYMGFESIVGETSLRVSIAAAAGGFLIGAARWFELQPEIQFGGAHRLLALLSFDAASAVGQLLALCVLVPAVGLYFRLAGTAKINVVILAGLTIHATWHQMIERATSLRRFLLQWPALNVPVLSPWLWALVSFALLWIWFRRRPELSRGIRSMGSARRSPVSAVLDRRQGM